jgi:hypothetical protein
MTLEEAYALCAKVLPDLPGWCTPEKACRLVRLVAEECPSFEESEEGSPPPARVVELGVFAGRSLFALALGCRVWGRRPYRYAEGIDPYALEASLEGTQIVSQAEWWKTVDHDAALRIATRALEEYGLGPFASILRLKSEDACVRYGDGSIGVLHQDANHSEEVSSKEVGLYLPKLRARGFWVMDDTDWASTRRAQDMLIEAGLRRIEDHGNWSIFKRP